MKERSSNRSFGLLFSIVFIIITFWPLLGINQPNYPFLIPALIFFILGIFDSKILTPLNKIWIKFGYLLGAIIAPIVMAVVFFVIITPIGLVMRLFRKDLLRVKFNKIVKTYWIKRKNIKSMNKQF